MLCGVFFSFKVQNPPLRFPPPCLNKKNIQQLLRMISFPQNMWPCAHFRNHYYYYPFFFSWVIFVTSQLLPTTQRFKTFLNTSTIPNITMKCLLPMKFDIFIFPCQNIDFFEMVLYSLLHSLVTFHFQCQVLILFNFFILFIIFWFARIELLYQWRSIIRILSIGKCYLVSYATVSYLCRQAYPT